MVVIVWLLESVTVTTKVGEVYSIQHNLIPFVSDLRQREFIKRDMDVYEHASYPTLHINSH
jgi:cellobiose phosphorylase